MNTLYSSFALAAVLLAVDASAQRIIGDGKPRRLRNGKPRRLRNLNEFVTDGFDSSMSISMIDPGVFPTECNKVVEGLTNRIACWSEDNPLVPVFTDECLADATCNCLTEYAIAVKNMSDEGRDAFGANVDTLGLVYARFQALDCEPLLGGDTR